MTVGMARGLAGGAREIKAIPRAEAISRRAGHWARRYQIASVTATGT